ncbi:tRNA synthetases class I-domain-containing protein [Peziza echinospora]|nr:tRNA synthetases class I-domain-containing protein [Peziza echinospora]
MLLPPPNVTGQLHIGHALMVSIQDSLARWYRMNGHPVRWLPGTDHAGIATQTVVERHLKDNRRALGREGLIPEIENADPKKEYYTLDEGLSNGVKAAFVRLHEEGLIYRSVKMVNWSVKAGTTLSEIELVTEDVGPEGLVEGAKFGELHQIVYRVVGDEEREVIVATTRPETVYGDVAIAVHPDDARYLDLHYQLVQHPLLKDVQIPIIPDAELVDPDFGSGAVKITPAHDTNDFEFWKRHSSLASSGVQDSSALGKKLPIPLKRIFGSDGKMISGNVVPFVAGMDRLAARIKTVYLLKTSGSYKGVTKHIMRIARCSRTGDVIEPMLLPQWFLRAKPLADKGRKTTRRLRMWILRDAQQKLLIKPFWFRNDWQNWLENMHDWCLSRQIWWGHRIPAWKVVDPEHPNNQKIPTEELTDLDSSRWIVAFSEAEARDQLSPEEQHFELHQDEDVLDTWFSSGLLPLTTAGWTGEADQPPEEWKKNYPLTFIESGHDILFFWLARMAMLCTWFTDTLPFNEILLHPLVCDASGRKMSKSEGNVLDPLAIIDGRLAQDLLAIHQAAVVSAYKKITTFEKLQGDPETASTANAAQLEQVRADLKALKIKGKPKGITESGADPLRMTLIDYLRQTRQISFDVHTVDQFRKLAIKVYNLCKYYQSLQQTHSAATIPTRIPEAERSALQLHDLYLLHHLRNTIATCTLAFQTRKLFPAVDALRTFIYDVLGNVYVMFIKPDLDSGTPASSLAALRLTGFAIDATLRLAHPIMPYLTEGLWQNLDPRNRQDVDGMSIMATPYPRLEDVLDVTPLEIRAFERVLDITEVVRGVTAARAGMSPKELEVAGMWVRVVVVGRDGETRRASKRYEAQIGKLCRLSEALRVVDGSEEGMAGELRRIGVVSVEDGIAEGAGVGEEEEKVPGRGDAVRVVRDGEGRGWWVLYESQL